MLDKVAGEEDQPAVLLVVQVVGPQVNVAADGAVSTVGGRQNPILGEKEKVI